MERAGRILADAWQRLPSDQQLLAAGAALLLVGFAILFWTPLGNRPVARYCFGLAVLCHLLLWGMAKQFNFASGTAASAVLVGGPPTDIVFGPLEEPSARADSAADADPLKAAVLDPRDRSAPIEPPRMARKKEETPLANETQEQPAPKAPPLPKTPLEEPATKALPLVAAPSMKDELVASPAPVVEPPSSRKEEPREPPASRPTPRVQDDRLAVAPEDPIGEIRAPTVKAPKTDPLEFTHKPNELARSAKPADDLDLAPTPAPDERPERKTDGWKKTSDPSVSGDIERTSRTIRRDAPLAVDSSKQLASALPIPRTTSSHESSTGSSTRFAPATGATSDADLAGAFAPAPAPVDAATNADGAGSPTSKRRLGPGGDLSGRRAADQRRQLLERFGGNAATERAVLDALAWLAAHQSPDGRWDCAGFMSRCPEGDKCEGKAIEKDSDVGVSAIVMLAFLGAGHTHRTAGTYRETVRSGLNWLLSEQAADGNLMGREKQGRVYSHAMATLALTEAYQMSADERLKPFCQKAVDWLVYAQERDLGGWRYAPKIDSDTSVFGWCVMALASARQAGLRVPDTCWEKAQTWLPRVSSGTANGLACYQPGKAPSTAMTAEALVCRQLFGLQHDSETTAEAAIYMLERAPTSREPNIYYWYYGTVAMFQVGGPRWERWNDALQQAILPGQRTEGHQKGSWDPGVPWGVDGGRVYATATNALCLEVYYRHLPIYKDTSTP